MRTQFLVSSLGYFALFNDLIDLFLAGMETTSSSLLWTFLFLLHHPDVQKKIHQELDEVQIFSANIYVECTIQLFRISLIYIYLTTHQLYLQYFQIFNFFYLRLSVETGIQF
jgi:cytochrome P450